MVKSLTLAEFNAFADIPPELEWLANITNPKTRRVYKVDVAEFTAYSELPDHTATARGGACARHRLARGPEDARANPASILGGLPAKVHLRSPQGDPGDRARSSLLPYCALTQSASRSDPKRTELFQRRNSA
jgi:hypothetical protein